MRRLAGLTRVRPARLMGTLRRELFFTRPAQQLPVVVFVDVYRPA
jgi:hypothetical protein